LNHWRWRRRVVKLIFADFSAEQKQVMTPGGFGSGRINCGRNGGGFTKTIKTRVTPGGFGSGRINAAVTAAVLQKQ